MVKKITTTFTCDHCKNEIVLGINQLYPYSEGWQYLYNLNVKIKGFIRELKDKHFCCLSCLNKFVTGWLKENAKS